jgi:hypothetical protein
MRDHFQILIKVPDKTSEDQSVNGPMLVERVRQLYGNDQADFLYQLLETAQEPGTQQLWQRESQMHLDRMHDLSMFMKLLKQRFTMWHNYRHTTRGTLWTERFQSLLVEEGEGEHNHCGPGW